LPRANDVAGDSEQKVRSHPPDAAQGAAGKYKEIVTIAARVWAGVPL